MLSPKPASAERRAALLQAAAQVAKNITTLRSLDELLPSAVDIICDAYNFYYAGVFLLDESRHWAVLRAGRGEAGRKMLEIGHKLEVGGQSMIGAAIAWREARIALDVGEEAVFFKNPYLPATRSEMALPLMVGENTFGAVTVQSVEEAAFSDEDISSLMAMADQLAIAIHNASLLHELERAHTALVRAKTYEALATATTQAIHWIGNKAQPLTSTVARMKADLDEDPLDLASLKEDLDIIAENARLIVDVRERLIGPGRDQTLRAALIPDVVQAAAFFNHIPAEKLSLEVAPDTPFGLTDTTQLARVLGYLFQNALEAQANHISATVTPTLDRSHIAISIADDGHGIAPEHKEQIWTAFFTTKGPSHAGLGLAAALTTLAQMGGRITVDSEPGKGATFTLVIPTAPDDEAIDLSHAPQNIFFVDEATDTWALFAANVLKLAGKNVAVQESPAGAAEADLILVDEALTTQPVMDIIEQLKEAGMTGKTVVVTAALDTQRAARYMKAGVKDVALKPYTYVGLAAFLNFEKE
ncbi:MAG: GAF domain-containing protein [Anaerolineales bacterium]|nr:GAF domain-containing protein [Anaerolineales bacterium]